MKLNTILSSLLVTLLATTSTVALAGADNNAVPNSTAAAPAPAADAQDDDYEDGVAGNYLSGQFARNSGDINEAIDYLRDVHTRSPDDVSVSIQLQGMLLLEGQIDEALEIAEDIEDSETKDPLSDLLLVLYEIKNNDLDKASAILQNAGEDGSVQLWVPLLSGWVDVSKNQLKKPLTVEDLNVDVGRAFPLVNYHLALINNQGGFKDEAAKNFKAAIDDVNNPPERIMSELLKFYAQNNSPEILTPLVKQYIEAHPGASAADAPVIGNPADGIAEVLYTMGGIMYAAGVVNDAAIYLQLAVYVKPEMDEATIALGDAYSDLKQYARSNETLSQIAPTSAVYERAQLHIAMNYEREDKLAEALKRLDIMSKSAPDDAEIFIAKGDLLRLHGRYRDAIMAYGDALKLMPNSEGAWAILFARASCYDRVNDWPGAQKDLRDALIVKPDQPDVLNYLGFALLERNENIDEARDMIEKAVKARPNDAQIIDSMGWVLYIQGDYKDAEDYLEKAVELLPGDPTVNDHLGDVYWRMGRRTEARFQWERSLTFSPEEKLVNALHKKLKDGLPPQSNVADGASAVNPSVTPSKPLMAGNP